MHKLHTIPTPTPTVKTFQCRIYPVWMYSVTTLHTLYAGFTSRTEEPILLTFSILFPDTQKWPDLICQNPTLTGYLATDCTLPAKALQLQFFLPPTHRQQFSARSLQLIQHSCQQFASDCIHSKIKMWLAWLLLLSTDPGKGILKVLGL